MFERTVTRGTMDTRIRSRRRPTCTKFRPN